MPRPATDTKATVGAEVEVWDPLVRVLHWTLVAAFAVAFATGDEVMILHRWAGYLMLGIVGVRLVWGLIGTRHARFADFVRGPGAVKAYLRTLLSGHPQRYLGHNPAGGAMIVALLATLLVGGSGLLTDNPGRLGAVFGEVHEVLANAMLGFVLLHVAGAVVSSLLHRENLVRAMISGRKPAGEDAGPVSRSRATRTIGGVLLLAAALAASGAAVASMGGKVMAKRALAIPETYAEACGECHDAYHPSLLPAASWQEVTDTLPDHFGEDASLDAATRAAVTAFLAGHAAESWDTVPSYRFRAVAADEPRRMTATAYWRDSHHELPEAVFALRSVGSKVNCSACHEDAGGGGFRKSRIAIPSDESSKEKS